MLRQRIRKDLFVPEEELISATDFVEAINDGKQVFPQKYRKKELVRVFEKNPELYQEFKKNRPTIIFYTGEPSKTYQEKQVIAISDADTKKGLSFHKDTGLTKRTGLEPELRHELKHVTDFREINNLKMWKKLPKSLKESSAKSAEYISVRNHKLPQKLIESEFGAFWENV